MVLVLEVDVVSSVMLMINDGYFGSIVIPKSMLFKLC